MPAAVRRTRRRTGSGKGNQRQTIASSWARTARTPFEGGRTAGENGGWRLVGSTSHVRGRPHALRCGDKRAGRTADSSDRDRSIRTDDYRRGGGRGRLASGAVEEYSPTVEGLDRVLGWPSAPSYNREDSSRSGAAMDSPSSGAAAPLKYSRVVLKLSGEAF